MNNWYIFFISHIFSWFHARNDSTCYELRGHCINAFDKFQPSASRLERKKQKTPCKPGTMERNGVCVCKLYYPAFDDCTILHLDLRECVSRMFGLELQWAWRYLSQPLHRQLRKLHQHESWGNDLFSCVRWCFGSEWGVAMLISPCGRTTRSNSLHFGQSKEANIE